MPRKASVWPKYVRRVVTKGSEYFYFDTGKRVDGKKVYAPLPHVRSMEFGGRYASLLGHRQRKSGPAAMRIPELVDLYEMSAEFKRLAPSSQANYGIYLRRLCALLPTAPVEQVTRRHMRQLLDKMAETPGAANLFLGTCGGLFKWAVEREYVSASPTLGIKPLEMGEHDPWPEHILAAALKAEDDRVRLLAHLLYYTALRLNDALSLTWGHIRDNRIVIRPQKTARKKVDLSIPVHKALSAELARHPRADVVIAINPNTGKRYGDMTARALLKDFAARYGSEVVPHGLRKNAINALLEAGATVAEAAAISGQTMTMVEHYAKLRNRARLADNAVLLWEANEK